MTLLKFVPHVKKFCEQNGIEFEILLLAWQYTCPAIYHRFTVKVWRSYYNIFAPEYYVNITIYGSGKFNIIFNQIQSTCVVYYCGWHWTQMISSTVVNFVLKLEIVSLWSNRLILKLEMMIKLSFDNYYTCH